MMKKEWNRIHIPKALSQQTTKGIAKAKQEEQRQKWRPLSFVGVVAALFLLIATTNIHQVTAYSGVSDVQVLPALILVASGLILYRLLGHSLFWITAPLILVTVAFYIFSMPYRPATPLAFHATVVYKTDDGKEAYKTEVELKTIQALGDPNLKRIKAIHVGDQTLTKKDFVFAFTYEAFRYSEVKKDIWQREQKMNIDPAIHTLTVEWWSGKKTQVPLIVMYDFPPSVQELTKHPTEDQRYVMTEDTTITAFIPSRDVMISHLLLDGEMITAEQLPVTLKKGSEFDIRLVEQPIVNLQQPQLPMIATLKNKYEIMYLDDNRNSKQRQKKYEEAIKVLLKGVEE